MIHWLLRLLKTTESTQIYCYNVRTCADTWLLRYLSITWLHNLRSLFHLNFLHTLSWPMHNQQFLPSNLCYWRKKKISRFRSLDKSFFTPFFKLIYSFWGSRFVGTPVFFYRSEKIAKTISALMLRFYFLTYVSTREVNFR